MYKYESTLLSIFHAHQIEVNQSGPNGPKWTELTEVNRIGLKWIKKLCWCGSKWVYQ